MPVIHYNPFTYRGYYYDAETGLYYLNSRYYNPNWGRFLNADCYLNANGDILGFNMFAYCGNNPVMGYDSTGEWSWNAFFEASVLSFCVAAIVVIGVAAVVVATGGSGAIIAAAAIGGTISGLQSSISVATEYESGEHITMDDSLNIIKNVAIDTAVSAASASITGGEGGKIKSNLLKKIVNVGIEGIKEAFEYSTDINRNGNKFTSRDIQEYVLSNHLPEILWSVFKEAMFS